MPELSEDGGLLQALRDEPIPPSTLDVSELVAGGRRKVRARNWVGAAAITTVLVAAIPVALVNARSPDALPERPPLATPTPAAIAPTTCTVELLQVPEKYDRAQIFGGDTSGRYTIGSVSKSSGGDASYAVWDNGEILPLSLPAGTYTLVVNRYGVIAGSGTNGAWVYRNAKYTTLPQPESGVKYVPYAINNKGQILGVGPGGTKGRLGTPPLIWAADNTIEVIAGRPFMARGIDDDGTVIGQEDLRQYLGDLHGLIWRPGKAVTDLPAPPGAGKAGALSIRDGWVAGFIAHNSTNDAPLKPFVFHLGTGQSVSLPPEVSSVNEVNSRGWAAVELTGASPGVVKPGLLAEGKLLRLPEPAGVGPRDSLSVRTISDDGRVLYGVIAYDKYAQEPRSVRWLCE